MFFVGGGLPAGDPGGRAQWGLSEAVEHMQDAYCGTLTAQFDHLASRYVLKSRLHIVKTHRTKVRGFGAYCALRFYIIS